jgi:hypothetical protein
MAIKIKPFCFSNNQYQQAGSAESKTINSAGILNIRFRQVKNRHTKP